MAKFYGEIGFGVSVEKPVGSGVYVDEVREVDYYGDVIRNSRRLEPGESLNDNLLVGNSISIVADEYASGHFFAMRYVRWAGTLWTITNVEVRSPRLILTLGSVYNGETDPNTKRG